jgi:hypothetical protein
LNTASSRSRSRTVRYTIEQVHDRADDAGRDQPQQGADEVDRLGAAFQRALHVGDRLVVGEQLQAERGGAGYALGEHGHGQRLAAERHRLGVLEGQEQRRRPEEPGHLAGQPDDLERPPAQLDPVARAQPQLGVGHDLARPGDGRVGRTINWPLWPRWWWSARA